MDLSILRAEGIADVRTVAFVGPFVRIHGTGFTGVTGIYINGVESPEWIVLSTTLASARIPASKIGAEITSIEVRVPARGSESSLLVWELLDSTVSGPSELAQRVLRLLLMSPGSDIFEPDAGGGILSMVGTSQDTRAFRVDVSRAIAKVSDMLLREPPGRPKSERFGSIQLLDCSISGNRASIQLRILALSGDAATIGVEL